MATNVASLELSKELYELSGWNSPYVSMDGPTPRYDLGYLLRKLPGHISLTNTTYDKFCKDYGVAGHKSFATFQSNKMGLLVSKGGHTSEDAACLLAIELFRQGILTKEPK